MRKLLIGFALLASVTFAAGCALTPTDQSTAQPTTTEKQVTTTTIAPSTTTSSTSTTTTSTTLPPTTTTEPAPIPPTTPDNGIIVQPDGSVDVPVDANGESLQTFLSYIEELCTQIPALCASPGFMPGPTPGADYGLIPSAYCDVWGRCYHSYSVWGNPYGACDIYGNCTGGRDIWGNPWGHCDIWGCHEP